jgi:hypothetical protein
VGARVLALAVFGLFACTDATGPEVVGGAAQPGGKFSAALSLGTRVVYLGAPKSEPVNYIRGIVYDKTTGTVLGRIDQSLDPSKNEFELRFNVSLPTPGFTNTRLTLELANRTGGAEIVQYSGRALDVKLQPADIRQVDIDIYPGPLENFEVSAVKITKPIPDRLERDSVRAIATIEGASAGSRVVWSSLDSGIARIDATSGVITGVLPGSARIVAAVGFNADTASIQILRRRDRVLVSPATSTLPQLGDTVLLTAKVVDPRGVEITGEQLVWSVGDSSIGELSDARWFKAKASGSTQVWAASLAEPTLRGSGAVVVTYVPPSLSSTTIQIAPDSIVANGTATSQVTVQLRDASGNSVTAGGKQVLAALTGAGTLSPLTDNGGGRYTATVTAPTQIGSASVSGTVGGLPLDARAGMRYIAGPPVRYILTTATTSTTAGGSITISAQLVDAFGNPVSGAGRTVNWSSANGGTFGQAGSTTDANGLATVAFTTGPVAGSSYTVVATDGTLSSVTGSLGPISTTPSSVSLVTSTVTASPTSLVASGSSQSVITVRLKDAHGNNLLASAGQLSVTKVGGGTLGNVSDNADGTYSVTLTAPSSAGAATISASLGSNVFASTATVVFTAGAASADHSTISASPLSIVANGTSTSTISVRLKDGTGNDVPASGGTVTLNRTGTGNLSAVTDNGDGTYTAILTSPILVGSAVISGTLAGNPMAASATVTFVAGPASRFIVTTSSATVVAGTTVTITAKLVDANGNAVREAGRVVTWSKTGAGGSFDPATSTTNAEGEASVTFTTASTSGTSYTFSATDTGASAIVGSGGTVMTTPGAVSLTTSTVTASPNALDANGTAVSTVTIQLKDANGNNVTSSAGPVTVSRTGTGTLSAATDHANGSYTATLTAPSSVGSAVVSAMLSGSALTSTATVNFVAGAASLSQSTLSASPASIAANGTSTSTITIQLKDASGNNLQASAGTVTLSKVGGGTLGAVTDNLNGTYTAVLTSPTSAGNAVVTGSLGGNNLTNTATVTFTAGTASLSTSTVTANPATVAAGATSAITVQLKDAGANNLGASGGVVTLTTDLGSIGTVTDNNNGTYSATLSTSATGTATISAKLDGNNITGTASVVVNNGAASAATSTLSLNASSLESGQTATATVVVKDAAGNVLTDATSSSFVLATTLGSLGTVTCSSGTCISTFTGTTAGTASITAKIGGTNISGSPASVEVVAGVLHHLAVTATDGSALSSTRTAGTAFNIRVVAQDAANNTVTGFTGTANLTTNSLFSSSTTTTTAAFTAGVLSSHAVTLIRAGTSRTITATKTSSSETGTSAGFTVDAGSLAKLQLLVPGETAAPGTTSGKTGTPDNQTAGTAFTATVNAVDANWNTVASTTHNIAITSSDGSATLPANADLVSGTKTFSVTLRTVGTKTVTATNATSGTITANTSPNITVVAGALDHLDLTLADGSALSTATLTANTQFDVKIVAKDADNNTLTGFTGTATISAAGATFGSGSGATASFSAGVLASHGIVITNGGTFTLTATASSKTGTSSITLAANLADAGSSTLAVGSNSLTSGQTTTVTVELKKADASVYTTGTSDNFNLTASLGTIGTVSCVNGTCTATYTASTSGSAVIAAKIGGVNIVNSTQTVVVSAGAPSTATSTFAVGANALLQNATTTATIVVKDAAGNTVTGASASSFDLAASIGSFGPVNCTSGTCTSTYTATTLGNASLTAKIGGTNIVNSPQSIEVASVPGAPTGLGATPGNGQVSLSWTAPASNGGSAITDYKIEYRLDGGSFASFAHTASTSTSIVVTGLTNGSLYNFQVSAVNALGTSAASSIVDATPRTLPDAPTAVTGTPAATSMALSWTAPASNGGAAITDYVVQYSATGAGSWTTFSHSASTATSLTVTGLTNGSTYDFRVSATNAAGTGAASSLFSGTVGSPSSPTLTASVNQVTNNSHTATLSWTVPTFTGTGITDYLIEYKTAAAGSYTVFPHAASTATSATIANLVNGTTYYFRVAGKTSTLTGTYSNVGTATTTKPSDRLQCYTPGSSNSSAATISIAPCTSVALGDLIVIPVGVAKNNDGSARAVTAEAGFSALPGVTNSDYTITMFYKHATAGDVGRTSNYVFSWTGNVKSIVTLVSYKGVTGTPTIASSTGTGTTASAPAVPDPSVASYSLVYVFAANASMGSVTPNLGQWTLSNDLYKNTTAGANNAQAIAIVTGDIDKNGAGSSSAKTATTSGMSGSVPWTGIVLRIQP